MNKQENAIIKFYEGNVVTDGTIKVHLEAIKYFDVPSDCHYDDRHLYTSKRDATLTKLLKERLINLLQAEAEQAINYKELGELVETLI
jgi:hypothetical protein